MLRGWHTAILDIDLRLGREADELLRAVGRLKDELSVNVELASPPDFIPELPGWRDRSPFVLREGRIDVHHFDLYSQPCRHGSRTALDAPVSPERRNPW